MAEKRAWIKTVFTHLGLVVLAAVLFAGSFPNPVAEYGIPFLAWFALIPIFVLVCRVNLLASIGWGAIYSYIAYGLFNYWLTAFHPLAGVAVSSVYMFYLAAVFFALKLAVIYFPRRYYIVFWIIWVAYEYLRTLGFLGYAFGIIGYSQWRMIPIIQIASLTGVWGVSALVVFPSAWLAGALKDWRFSTAAVADSLAAAGRHIQDFFSKEKKAAVAWLAAFAATLGFGLAADTDFSDYPVATIALIQPNTDPWAPSHAETFWQVMAEYRLDFDVLSRLSEEALAAYPRPQMVVWPETAFVPRIHWHQTYRTDPASWALVSDLLDFLDRQDVPFVIGNDDGRRDPDLNPNPHENFQVNFNAALLFERSNIIEVYRKIRLVPFTEHFPFRQQFPRIYNFLVNADTHFWHSGTERTVFQGPGFTFSTPICFEDSFGDLSREFVLAGADVLVNLSNMAWAGSLSSQNQQLKNAVFRAVENRRPMVRSTASGQTAAIDPAGRILAMAPPFEEAWLNAQIPLARRDTLYTRFGDYFGVFFAILAIGLLLFGAAYSIVNQAGHGKKTIKAKPPRQDERGGRGKENRKKKKR
ncbi:MAG: apolipoprotein N-acyltransferase [Spirochaetes bacterium]|nr:apolipoprotein N-acyltransferase [Spirochaetota bacterium]